MKRSPSNKLRILELSHNSCSLSATSSQGKLWVKNKLYDTFIFAEAVVMTESILKYSHLL